MSYKTKEAMAEYQRSFYQKNKERMKEYNRKRYHERWGTVDGRRREVGRNLQRYYGITLAQYDEMWASQNGKCKLCDFKGDWSGERLHVDHNHDTGLVRGLLCSKCNTALGLLGESPDRLRKAAEYLQSFGGSK